MPETLFTEVTEKVLALSYEQTILLINGKNVGKLTEQTTEK